MVADALVYHPSLTQLLKLFGSTVGRDKLMRTVQYFARFYAWYLARGTVGRGDKAVVATAANATRIAAWTATKKQLALARKFLRVGKALEHIRAAAVAADAAHLATDPFVRYASVARQLAYAGYLTLDSLALPHTAGIVNLKRGATWTRDASRLWVVGLVCSITAQTYSLHTLGSRLVKVDKKEGDGIVEFRRLTRERAAARKQLLMDLLDLTIPTSALGWLKLDDGFVGLAGVVSSLMGLSAQWNKP